MSDVWRYRPLRLAMWSGPRNISTAMMRAWENRPDCVVEDEPFYAHYLHHSGKQHPMGEAVMQSQPTDWREVVQQLLRPLPDGIEVQYQKHMCHHMLSETGIDWLVQVSHCFLIRDPERVIRSYARKQADFSAEDLGFPQQTALYNHVSLRGAAPPPVIDADDVLADPAGVLRALCHHFDIEFTDRMLAWPPGLRDSDGVWATHWYDSVARSRGFAAPAKMRTERPLNAHEQAVLRECEPHYRALYARRLTGD